MRAWFLQANPAIYDVEAALVALDRLWWRVPQYTSDVHPGDVVVLWRSGKEAGVIGIGRVLSEPQEHEIDPAEQPFVLDATEDPIGTTRVLTRLQPVPFVSKDKIRAVPELREHQIIRAPMGTVFALSDSEWSALSALLPEPPTVETPEVTVEMPSTFAWAQRAKGVLPMPGGYDGYLDTLDTICALVETERPSPSELATRLETALGVTRRGSETPGLVLAQDWHRCRRRRHLRAWSLDTPLAFDWRCPDHHRASSWTVPLHRRVAPRRPRGTDDHRAARNRQRQYGMGWDTQTQISNRRGWLQSAGMLMVTEEGTLQASAAGIALLADLVLYNPAVAPPPLHVTPPLPPMVTPSPPRRGQGLR